jgi:hypothetical protein
MREEIESRLWADHQHQISGGVSMVLGDIAAVFRTLNAQRFDAPWQRHRKIAR